MGHAVPASRRRPSVRVEPLEARQLMSTVPNDPDYNVDLRFTNINAPAAWDITTGTRTGDPTKDPVIVVLDTGVDIFHEDFKTAAEIAGDPTNLTVGSAIFTNPFEIDGDGVDNDGNGFVDDAHGWDFINDDNEANDDQGHGTHVAGIIGAVGNNGIGITGVAWNTTLLPIKVLGPNGGTDAQINAGIRYATMLKRQGINVVAINASLGGLDPIFLQASERAVREAGEAGILFVAASGNDANNIDPGFTFPAKFSLGEPSVITVAATDSNDQLATFSNVGAASVQVAAPGNAIFSAAPGGGFVFNSGTSMAAPEVSGLVALLASANPRASMAQIKSAILESVDRLDSLDAPHALPLFVSTGGRINAYAALKNILNLPVKTDAATSGNWKGNYGAEGFDIPGNATGLPLGTVYTVSVAPEPGTPFTGKTTALESSTGTERVTTQYRADQFIDVNLNIPPNFPHRVSLYFTNLSGSAKRTQLIEIFNPDTGALINSMTVGDFAKGKYVTFEVFGNVNIRVSKVAGKDVVLNGLFVDPVTSAPSGFQGIDTTTGGNWRSREDRDGAYIVGRTDFPTNVTATVTGADTQVISGSTSRKGALLLDGDAKRGSVAYQRTTTSATIDLVFNDNVPHEVTVYAIDFDKKKRAQRVELLDASGNLLDQRELTNFTGGAYLTWNVTGDVKIRFTRLAGPDAVISAVFIDEQVGTAGHYRGLDTTTGGSWKGHYGLDAAFIAGDVDDRIVPNPSFSLPIIGATLRTITESSWKANAVQQYINPAERIASQYETRDTMTLTIDLDPTDGPQRVSLYAADYERKRRVQRVEVFDANGVLIGSTDMVAFNNGQYASFDVVGDATVVVTNLGNNANRAVLSAVFYD